VRSWGDKGSQHLRRQGAGSHDHSSRRRGCLLRPQGVRGRGRGPRVASTSRSARSMLPGERGAGATAIGDGASRAPLGARPRRVRAWEVPGAARFASSFLGASMLRGPPALGVHRVGIFALFLLPRGRPWRFAPELDPAAAVEAEGSIGLGGR
jgi:hypothetical protein